MKHHILFLLFFASILITACSDQFLKDRGPHLVEMSNDTILLSLTPNKDTILQLQIKSLVDANYQVYQYPKFMLLKTMNGEYVQGNTSIELTLTNDFNTFNINGNLCAQLILDVEAYGLVQYTVAFNRNTDSRRIEFIDNEISFEKSDSAYVRFCNNSQSEAWWSVYSHANWLNISSGSGIIMPGACDSVLLMVNRSNIEVGKLSSQLIFSINGEFSYAHQIPVAIEVHDIIADPEKYNLQLIEGSVVDVHHFANENKVLILTNSPNQLIMINLHNGSQTEIALTKKSSRMAVAETGNEVLVASTFSLITHIDLSKLNIIKEFELPFVPFDIEFGENGWSYASSDQYNKKCIACINLNNNDINQTSIRYWYNEKLLLKKIPGQEMLTIIPTNSFPSKPLLVDISSDSVLIELHEYVDLNFLGNVWFLKNTALGISRNKEIIKFNFELPIEKQMKVYGSLPQTHEWKEINYFSEDCCNKTAAICFSEFSYENNSSVVSIIETENFNETKVFSSTTLISKAQKIHYAFINSKANKLYMLVHARERYIEDEGIWYIETKELE